VNRYGPENGMYNHLNLGLDQVDCSSVMKFTVKIQVAYCLSRFRYCTVIHVPCMFHKPVKIRYERRV